MYLKNYYQKECFLFYNYYNFISFLEKVYEENKKRQRQYLKPNN